MRITKDPETRRQEIIDEARTLFESKGISKTSMAEIADKIGVAKGLVYYYFSSKEELVDEVVEQFIQGLDESLKDIVLQDDLDFYGKLTAILVLYFNAFQNDQDLMKFTPADPGVFNLIRERLSAIALFHVKALLQAGMSQNLIRIDYPEYVLKILITGLGDLYIEGIRDPKVHASLIEQMLGMQKGQLEFGLQSR